MTLKITKVDQQDEAVRRRLVEMLADYELHALFILGNLRRGFPGSHIYVASIGGTWVGAAGYYAGPKSLIPFSTRPAVVRSLVRYVSTLHPDMSYLNGIDYVAEPAYEELLRLGFEPDNDPHLVFMQLEGEPPSQPHEELARPVAESDAEDVAKLNRYARDLIEPDAPISEHEIAEARMNPLRHVLVVGDTVVSTAGTNGIGLEAFQILGVVTHPDFRGRGYAGAVCASLIRAMGREGARRCVLFTRPDNVAARRCYARIGFHDTGQYYVAKLKRPSPRS
jgi:ribosomal protein S18 acetylase RimI-like enzyme